MADEPVLITNAEVGGQIRNVRIEQGCVASTDRPGAAPARDAAAGDRVIDARGGALIKGLHDHHIHAFALAASLASLRCGPPHVEGEAAFVATLRRASPEHGWLRGTGYFESVAGPLDRNRLDRIRDDVPLRIQHRSGVMWFLNTRAIEALELGAIRDAAVLSTIERDPSGRPTGRLFRADAWLRERLPPSPPPDLARVGAQLATYGVTGLTDCTATNGPSEFEALRGAAAKGALPQRLRIMGRLALGEAGFAPTREDARAWALLDAHKIMLDEPALPPLDALTSAIRAAHEQERNIAFHAVTRTELLFLLAALEAAGPRSGDRIEHASIAPPETIDRVRAAGLTIVTQPNFVSERGDAYLRDVDERDQPNLYRVRSWLEAGVRLAIGTDAPFGDPDPWRAMRAAVDRTSAAGITLGEQERISPERAIALFDPALGHGSRRGHDAPPTLEEGALADLCLLDAPWSVVRTALDARHVRATLRGGEVIHAAVDPTLPRANPA